MVPLLLLCQGHLRLQTPVTSTVISAERGSVGRQMVNPPRLRLSRCWKQQLGDRLWPGWKLEVFIFNELSTL